ncbi:MAG: trypsin-like peptidase domain-containing protein [Clostridia bacterium]|nr:trypsin-like peptidase domain-containing protein [Clostridia bacterium]
MKKFKRIIAISFVCIFLSNLFSIYAVDTNDTESISLLTYDCVEGKVVETTRTFIYDDSIYSTPAEYIPNTRAIVSGDGEGDNRFKVNAELEPYSKTGDIYLDWDFDHDGTIDRTTHSGTGFMVGPDIMLTAAHVVYWKNSTEWDADAVASLDYYADKVYYVTKRNGQYDYEEISESVTVAVPTDYITSVDNETHDWAVVQLNTNVGDRTGWFDIGITSGSLNDNYFIVSGYPDDADKQYSQWASTGFVEITYSSSFAYAIDTSGGQSGAPVSDSLGTVWGIHVAGGTNYNYAYRFSSSVYSLIQEKITESLERYSR